MGFSTIRTTGIDTKKVTEAELIELLNTSDVQWQSKEEPEGYVKLVLKRGGEAGNGVGFHGFQGMFAGVTATADGPLIKARVLFDEDGNPNASVRLTFRRGKFGQCTAILPLTKFNLNKLILAESTNTGAPWKIADDKIAAKVKKEGKKIKDARLAEEKALFAMAEKAIHNEKATAVNALQKIYEEAYRDIDEYKKSILPAVQKLFKKYLYVPKEEKDALLKEYAADQKVGEAKKTEEAKK